KKSPTAPLLSSANVSGKSSLDASGLLARVSDGLKTLYFPDVDPKYDRPVPCRRYAGPLLPLMKTSSSPSSSTSASAGAAVTPCPTVGSRSFVSIPSLAGQPSRNGPLALGVSTSA